MKNILIYIFIGLFFSSCNYFDVQEKENNTSEIIAIVNTQKLFKEDIIDILPKNIIPGYDGMMLKL